MWEFIKKKTTDKTTIYINLEKQKKIAYYSAKFDKYSKKAFLMVLNKILQFFFDQKKKHK